MPPAPVELSFHTIDATLPGTTHPAFWDRCLRRDAPIQCSAGLLRGEHLQLAITTFGSTWGNAVEAVESGRSGSPGRLDTYQCQPGHSDCVTSPGEDEFSVTWLSAESSLVGEVRSLLEEYIRLPDAWERHGGVPDVLPDFFREELDGVPGDAAPPHGEVLVARVGGEVVAAGFIVPLDGPRCEFKRVFVRGRYRGKGIASSLGEAMLTTAARLGYETAALDVMPERLTAIGLWLRLGFEPCGAYRQYPFAMEFLARPLVEKR